MKLIWIASLCLFSLKSYGSEIEFPSWVVGIRGQLIQTDIDFSQSVSSSQNTKGDVNLFNVGLFGQKEFLSQKKFSGTLLAFVSYNLGNGADPGSLSVRGLRYGGELTGNVNFQYRSLRIQPLLGVGFSLGTEEIESRDANGVLMRNFSNTRVKALVGCRFMDRYEHLMSSLQLGYNLSHSGSVIVSEFEEDLMDSGLNYDPLIFSIHLGYLF